MPGLLERLCAIDFGVSIDYADLVSKLMLM